MLSCMRKCYLNLRGCFACGEAGFACRTIADGTCAFPKNLFGCGNQVVAGDVKFISDDIKIECEVGSGIILCEV